MNRRTKLGLFIVAIDNQSSTTARIRQIVSHPEFAFRAESVYWGHQNSSSEQLQLTGRIKKGIEEADLILLHRVFFPKNLENWVFNQGKPVVFDFDDAIYAVPSSSYQRESKTFLGWGKRFLRMVKRGRPDFAARYQLLVQTLHRVQAVSAGNPHLAQFASNYCNEVMVVPTSVDVVHFPVKEHQSEGPITIGWYGSPDNQWYLDTIAPALRQVFQQFETRVNFQIISSRPYETSGVPVNWIPWKRETELQNLLKFDIGLMPLTEDEWAKGKSGNKAIYYLGLGIPAIVSPIGVNEEIVVHGQNGFQARTIKEWVDALCTLIQDAELRRKMGIHGREWVTLNYSRQKAVYALNTLLQKVVEKKDHASP